MNCRPGDLTRIVSNWQTDLLCIADKFVKLADAPSILVSGEPGWAFEQPVEARVSRTVLCPAGVLFREGEIADVYEIQDKFLRPIRAPGVGAIDQMIERVGKPREVTA